MTVAEKQIGSTSRPLQFQSALDAVVLAKMVARYYELLAYVSMGMPLSPGEKAELRDLPLALGRKANEAFAAGTVTSAPEALLILLRSNANRDSELIAEG